MKKRTHSVDGRTTYGLIVPEWVEDLKFHCLAEVVNLKKSSLKGADYTGPAKRDQQFFDRIQVDDAIGKA